jgi:hypothetical protein
LIKGAKKHLIAIVGKVYEESGIYEKSGIKVVHLQEILDVSNQPSHLIGY